MQQEYGLFTIILRAFHWILEQIISVEHNVTWIVKWKENVFLDWWWTKSKQLEIESVEEKFTTHVINTAACLIFDKMENKASTTIVYSYNRNEDNRHSH